MHALPNIKALKNAIAQEDADYTVDDERYDLDLLALAIRARQRPWIGDDDDAEIIMGHDYVPTWAREDN
jgi:hypothetical protein